MDSDLTAITGLLIAIVTVVFVGLIWLIKKQFDQSNTTIQGANKANTALAESIEKLTVATQQQSDSMSARDKRDHDFQKEVMQSFKKIFASQKLVLKTQDRNYDAVINQKVGVQTVGKQIIAKK